MAVKRLKVVFMGTPEFACPPLFELSNDPDIEIRAVVTAEDKPVGRKQVLTPPPVKVLALEKGIPVLQPAKLSGNTDFLELIRKLKPDFIVVTAFGKILKKELLDIPKYGCINLHGSLLPKYRGASPVEEALLNGDKETGISFIRMTETLDAGDILLLQRLHIEPTDEAASLRKKLSFMGARLLPYLLKDIVDGMITPIPQDESKATFCRKIRKEDGLLNLGTLTAKEVLNRIRAYSIWPQCNIVVGGKRVKILEAAADESRKLETGKFTVENGALLMGTKNGVLLPKRIQLEGKKPMEIQEFLRGNSNFFR
jgi:methionyl-tRNA formyltransferase